jgi:protein-disulfide isomerase
MGGASRNEKRRKQEAANARLRAAGITPPTKASDGKRTTFIAVAALAVVALVVGITVLLTRDTGEPVVPTYTATASGAVVTAGNGPIVIDVYEDYLCPICERFEERYGEELTTALNNGQVTVRYHAVSILDSRTDPAGYSTRAANAAVCAAPAGIFPGFHKALFDNQPAEGSAGLTDEQLVAFGDVLGATGDFAGCVTGAVNAAAVAAETETAAATPAVLNEQGQFGTPMVLLNGAQADIADTGWLQKALAGS